MYNALVAPTIALAVKYYLMYKEQTELIIEPKRRLKPLKDYFNKPSS